jgi:hypothetical protein
VGPKTLEYIASNPAALEKIARKISEEDGELITGEQLRAKLVGGSVIVGQQNRGWSLKRMFELTAILQEVINNMTWTFIIADESDDGFLTTDNPVALYDPAAPYWVAFESSPYAHFLFPLCRTVCLLATHQEAAVPISKFSASQVRDVNKHCIWRADRQLYAPFKSNAVQRLLDEHVKRSRRKRVLLKKGRALIEDVPKENA